MSQLIAGKIRGLKGWKGPTPITDDEVVLPRSAGPLHLPEKVQLDLSSIPVRDQGQENSCVGHGIGCAYAYLYKKESGQNFDPSEMFIWTVTRQAEGSLRSNEGVYIKDAVKQVTTVGLCTESVWPYDEKMWSTMPSSAAYADAQHRKLKFGYRLPNLSALRAAIAHGLGGVLGFTVFDSIWNTPTFEKTGVLPLWKNGEKPSGGHCVYAFGYDDKTRWVRCRNSWGHGFGDGGDIYIPYDYFERGECDDMHALTNVEIPA